MATNQTFKGIKAQLSEGRCFGKRDMTAARTSLPPRGGDQTRKIDALYARNSNKDGGKR